MYTRTRWAIRASKHAAWGRQIARRALYRYRLRTKLHNTRVVVHSYAQDFYLVCNSLGSELLKSILVQPALRSRYG